jgi:hypothetical protein
MSTTLTGQPVDGRRRSRRPIAWLSVGLFATAMSAATSFWMQSLAGADGAIERSQEPFNSWLRDTALLLPLFVLAVLGVFALAHRKFGPQIAGAKAVIATAVGVVLAGSLVGVATLSANAAYDYRIQSRVLQEAHFNHSTALTGETATVHSSDFGHTHLASENACDGICVAKRQTLQTHIKGVKLVGGYLGLTNLVLVGWILAARGGRIESVSRRRRRSLTPAVPATTSTPEPASV